MFPIGEPSPGNELRLVAPHDFSRQGYLLISRPGRTGYLSTLEPASSIGYARHNRPTELGYITFERSSFDLTRGRLLPPKSVVRLLARVPKYFEKLRNLTLALTGAGAALVVDGWIGNDRRQIGLALAIVVFSALINRYTDHYLAKWRENS